MSNKTQLQTNNTALDALITRVNAAKDTAASLPEAGGSSDGSIQTCTVTFDHMDTLSVQIVATVVESGSETIYTTIGDYNTLNNDYPITIQNVKCGSALIFELFDDFIVPSNRVVETGGGASVVKFYRSSGVYSTDNYTTTIVIKAPTIAGTNGTVNIM